jgi:aminomethyltransferase
MAERRTPFYDIHLRTSAQMVKGGGDYMFPVSYTSPVEEHLNTRANVGMQDLSSMGEIDVKGPGAERLLNHLLVNEIRTLEPGRLRYTTMCNDDGGVIDDVTVYKFHDEHFMVVASSGPRKATAQWIADQAVGTSAYVTDVSGGTALLSVQGPRSRELLATAVSGIDLDALRFFAFTDADIAGVDALISRSGYTGELGYELYLPAEEAAVVWEHLMARGKPFELQPYGVAAMNSLRVEKALPLYGKDINTSVTPFHVGLNRWVRFDKRQFIGRDALLRTQEEGIDQRWTGLVLDSPVPAAVDEPLYPVGDVASYTDEILTGPRAGDREDAVEPAGEAVGHITVSVKGHTVDKMLAMAYVDTAHSWPGNRLVVQINGQPRQAHVVTTPFFDPDGARMKG